MQKREHTEVVAIASSSAEKGREVAHYLGIPLWHGSYEALLADSDVDVVYNPLPNDQHVLWSICACWRRAGGRTS
jgi:predicted dehydrogenase